MLLYFYYFLLFPVFGFLPHTESIASQISLFFVKSHNNNKYLSHLSYLILWCWSWHHHKWTSKMHTNVEKLSMKQLENQQLQAWDSGSLLDETGILQVRRESLLKQEFSDKGICISANLLSYAHLWSWVVEISKWIRSKRLSKMN